VPRCQPVVAVHQTQQSGWAVQSCCTTYIQAMQRLRGACRQASVQAHCMIHVAVQHGQCYSSLASTTNPSDAMHADSSLQVHAGLPAWCVHPRKAGTCHGTWHQHDTSLQPIRAAAGATCLFHVGSSMQAPCSKQLRYGQGSPACICRVLVTDRQGRADPPLLPPTSSGHLCGPGLPSCQQLRLSSSDARRNLIVA
jgi:hypothetical protein